MDQQHASLETLKDIRRIMDRSQRFISLSGLSGVSAGIIAFIGVYLAHNLIVEYYLRMEARGYSVVDFRALRFNLFMLAGAVLTTAVLFSFYFTWRKAKKNGLPLWDHSSKKLFINMMVPLVAGGIFVLGMLQYNIWHFVAPATLVFYGLALVNASKYTLGDIRYLGYIEIILGLINLWFIGYGLYFWAAGFGMFHIVYGLIMWWKYDYK